MLDRIITLSATHRAVLLSLVVLVAGLGAWNFTRLPIDAVPDITNVQVVVNTEAPGYTPLEVEQRVSFLVENARDPNMIGLTFHRTKRMVKTTATAIAFSTGTKLIRNDGV